MASGAGLVEEMILAPAVLLLLLLLVHLLLHSPGPEAAD